MNVKCDEENHWINPMLAGRLLFYVILPPVLALILLYRNKRVLGSPHVKKAWGFLYVCAMLVESHMQGLTMACLLRSRAFCHAAKPVWLAGTWGTRHGRTTGRLLLPREVSAPLLPTLCARCLMISVCACYRRNAGGLGDCVCQRLAAGADHVANWSAVRGNWVAQRCASVRRRTERRQRLGSVTGGPVLAMQRTRAHA